MSGYESLVSGRDPFNAPRATGYGGGGSDGLGFGGFGRGVRVGEGVSIGGTDVGVDVAVGGTNVGVGISVGDTGACNSVGILSGSGCVAGFGVGGGIGVTVGDLVGAIVLVSRAAGVVGAKIEIDDVLPRAGRTVGGGKIAVGIAEGAACSTGW